MLENTGPGIPEEHLEKIFDAGFTSHTQSAECLRDGGWPAAHRGLGLSITRSIIEAAGGRIRASNRTGGGARFEIELPIRSR
jgi:two-component system sensor histidine kinase ChvG